MLMASCNISKETINRLVKDVKDLIKNPLSDNYIYYKHDDNDLLKGYALIIGPDDTPYFGGYYFFSFSYPHDYPYRPPHVIFHTNAKKIRFNPNLYTNGKVCLSILNTWEGDKWSSCQSIRTLLLSILTTLMNKNPLLNEPGIDSKHPDFYTYTKIIEFSNINYAICGIITKKIFQSFFSLFENEIKELFLKNYKKIIDIVENKINADFLDNNINLSIKIYNNISLCVDYNKVLNKLYECNSLLQD